MGMVVRAKSHSAGDVHKPVGYYNNKRRYAGDEFELSDEKDFSKNWMEEVKGNGSVAVGIELGEKKKKKE